MIRLILTAAALLLAGPALAQFPAPVYQSFAPTARAPDLTAGVATARVALGVVAPVAYVCNVGTVTAYVKLGTVTVVASLAADVPVQAGACITLSAARATHLAGITASSTAVVQVTLGSGSPSVAMVGSPVGASVSAASITSLASSASSVQLLAANASRLGLILYNSDANTAYVKYGATATTALGGYTVPIPSGGYWEMPRPIYTGRMDVIWSSLGSGGMTVTEQ